MYSLTLRKKYLVCLICKKINTIQYNTRRHSRPTNQLLNLETARAKTYCHASEEQDECLEHPAPITLYYAEILKNLKLLMA